MNHQSLDQAMRLGRCVDLHRSIADTEPLCGFIVAVGERWVLLHEVSDHLFMNGYVAVRTSDITGVAQLPDDFVERALEAFGETPENLLGVDVDSDVGLVHTMADKLGLISVYVERDDPDVCFIGQPANVTATRIVLRSVTPAAEWEDETTAYAFSDVTRVDGGGRYERGLALVAGEP